jgi:demethylmenaquinone methyltransferase/2-methoxy-6-polyprenyl-1,4-benzoquinol methylase
MKEYYQKRAPVYDRVYAYSERQADLRFLEEYIPEQLSGLDVLEIAAGTGYWTQYISRQAQSILATDVSVEVIQQLLNRNLPTNVTTMVTDAYALENITQSFGGAFAGLWLSHVPRQRLRGFVRGLHRHLKPGSVAVYIDNSAVQCQRLPITDRDEFGNTYQQRVLDSGISYRVLKNFPTRQELLELVNGLAGDTHYIELENFWLFKYTLS